MEYYKRQIEEKRFYNLFYKEGWEKQTQLIDETIVPHNMLIYWRLVKGHINSLEGQQPEIRALDLGCGYGVLTVLLARMGVKVTAVDISFNAIKIAKKLACANGVEERICFVVAALESLPFKDGYFDYVLGTRVLHHVDIPSSGFQLRRVLKPEGTGIFWEGTEKNFLLRFARNYINHIRSIIPIPKFGTNCEHPLTKVEINSLGMIFGKHIYIVDAPFYFFGFIDEYFIRQRAGIISKIIIDLDALVAKYLPYLNRYSFHQIIVLEKNGGEK
jgi:SAM-dependent methyltransferase